ncbi:MAG: S-adenosylmethionine:tRNA ribosyltransferase-isomerase, partial [Treponema sp.]|nr:S-adenosylmethionine:tRNA ribosyltransferase-isomerase [Treponema sp.]
PVRETNIENHKMHSEFYTVPDETARKVNEAKKARKKILAVGTTSCRTLESACNSSGVLQSGSNSTNIFMYPPYKFKIVDELFTNFHTPESTLLMLVSAFAGKENIFVAYKQAIQDGYHFFSYGDAMYIRS